MPYTLESTERHREAEYVVPRVMHECAICGLVSTEAPCPACGDDESVPIVETTKSDSPTPQDSQLPFGLDSEPQPESTNLPFGLEENPEQEEPENLVFGIESSPNQQNRKSIPFGIEESPPSDV